MIVLPQKFEEILNKDTSNYYKGAVYTTCSKFDEIFSENKLYFFEEYTDHGIRHINGVLEACASLITPDTYKLLSEKDISILILSVFLHDLGMHLQPLTFKKMITGGYDDVLNTDLGDQKWSALWESYLFEAKKFNDQQRIKIFGDAGVDITVPDLSNPDSLTGIHRKLIGEFIRRYHPRIAYEVAFKGLTTHEGNQIDFCSDFDFKHKLLAGMLARSHGMNIRDTFAILEKIFTKRVWRRPINVHIVYLMSILRLADYFQIDTARVLKVPFLTRLFQSPVSFAEHKKHLQTTYIQPSDDDPETLYVTAEPTNSTYFLALENLFRDIQNEVDSSWAVLGEVYGLKPFDEQPKLIYRRIRSNIDDKRTFEETVTYVPERISFSVDKEVPKLLVGPLYDYDPSFGVRELLQNAVDACWEREFYEKEKGTAYEGAISIKIEPLNDQYVFSIRDNGKGMTLDEIKKYFLKVGGSIRKSAKWQHEHVDDGGHSDVNKCGRFGIGVLAAYLLGSEIEVKTKSISSPTGYFFKTTLEQEQIEIKKDISIFGGTEIKILISNQVYHELIRGVEENRNSVWQEGSAGVRFDKWYTLNSPKISFDFPSFLPGDIGYENFLPGIYDELDEKWNEINDENYKRIIWSYWCDFSELIICNGIIFPNEYEFENSELVCPVISVFDFDAKLPINLSRTFVSSLPSFENRLIKDIYRDFIAKVLLTKVECAFRNNNISLFNFYIEHPCLRKDELYLSEFNLIMDDFSLIVYCKDGFVLNSPVFLNQVSQLNYLKVFINDVEDFKNTNAVSFSVRDVDLVSLTITAARNKLYQLRKIEKYFTEKLNDLEIIGWTNDIHSYLKDTGKNGINFSRDIQQEFIKDKWPYENMSIVYYKTPYMPIAPSIFSEVVIDLLGDDLIIPYNIEDRKKKFPKAFKELELYMRKYLNNK
jgi:molecular chaperone HtpG